MITLIFFFFKFTRQLKYVCISNDLPRILKLNKSAPNGRDEFRSGRGVETGERDRALQTRLEMDEVPNLSLQINQPLQREEDHQQRQQQNRITRDRRGSLLPRSPSPGLEALLDRRPLLQKIRRQSQAPERLRRGKAGDGGVGNGDHERAVRARSGRDRSEHRSLQLRRGRLQRSAPFRWGHPDHAFAGTASPDVGPDRVRDAPRRDRGSSLTRWLADSAPRRGRVLGEADSFPRR